MAESYVERVWLNPPTSPSTGSIAVYDGVSPFAPDTDELSYVEVADCHQKVRLHQTKNDSREDFATKVEVMRDVLDRFARHLRSVP